MVLYTNAQQYMYIRISYVAAQNGLEIKIIQFLVEILISLVSLNQPKVRINSSYTKVILNVAS